MWFDKAARVVIVGITPGRQQMRNALLEAHRILKSGASDDAAIEGAKVFASFSGPMRSNLVALLDHIGLNRLIGVTTTASLWDADAHQVHFTSALRYPVFLKPRTILGHLPSKPLPFSPINSSAGSCPK